MKITLDNVLPLLRAAVDTRGDSYRYTEHHRACSYVGRNGDPSCLVGVVLHRAGHPIGGLDDAHTKAGSTDIQHLVSEGFVFDVDPPAAKVLRCAQREQDTGSTWGRAYAKAEALHRQLVGVA